MAPESERAKYQEAAADLKWAIRAIASAREKFLTLAYTDRLVDIENSVIEFRNEIRELHARKK